MGILPNMKELIPILLNLWASLVAQTVKHLPAMRETSVKSLSQEDPLEKEMGTHPSTLAWKIPWSEEPGTVHGVTNSQTWLSDFIFFHFLNLFQKIEEDRTLSNSFYEMTTTTIWKPDKATKNRKKIQANTLDEHKCQSPQQNMSKVNLTIHKKGHTLWTSLIHSRVTRMVQHNHCDQIRSVAQLCPTLCVPMNCSTPGLPVHHQLPEFTQTHVHWVSDAIQPSHPLSSASPPAPNPSQHQSLFQWVNSSHEVAKVLEFQL